MFLALRLGGVTRHTHASRDSGLASVKSLPHGFVIVIVASSLCLPLVTTISTAIRPIIIDLVIFIRVYGTYLARFAVAATPYLLKK